MVVTGKMLLPLVFFNYSFSPQGTNKAEFETGYDSHLIEVCVPDTECSKDDFTIEEQTPDLYKNCSEYKVIRKILSLGPYVKVISPQRIVRKIVDF